VREDVFLACQPVTLAGMAAFRGVNCRLHPVPSPFHPKTQANSVSACHRRLAWFTAATQMKILAAILLTAGLLSTLSCAHLQPELSADAKPDGNAAVLFGRFCVGHNFAFENKLGLWLENTETKHSVYLYFDADEPVYGVSVKPGHYRIMGFAALDRLHAIQGHRTIPQMQQSFAATGGSEFYLGDVVGDITWNGAVSTWRIKSWTNNFTATTAEFRQKYPALGMTPAQSVFHSAMKPN